MPDNVPNCDRIDFPPYDGKCPCCGHEFTLADLKRMATGDGWQRLILIVDENDPRGFISVNFDDYRPHTMKEWTKGISGEFARVCAPTGD